jgi:hypothetical protein
LVLCQSHIEQASVSHGSPQPQEELEVFVRFALFLLALFGLSAQVFGQSAVDGRLAGRVFEDSDGDGRRGPGEPPLAGIVVCTVLDCAVTDDEGSYDVPVEAGTATVWIRQPDGLRPTRSFWRRVPEDPFEWLVDFGLESDQSGSADADGEFTFLHASDTHLDEESLPRIRRLRELAEERGVAFVVITGDLIRDALRVGEETATGRYRLFREETNAFPMPVWVVPGNHEIFGIERHLSGVAKEHPLYGKAMFERFLGPTCYSFDHGGIHFIGLDTASFDDRWYYGDVSAKQLEWLAEDLSHVDDAMPIVTFNHIPLVSALVTVSGFGEDDEAPGSVIEVEGTRRFRHIVGNFADVAERFRGRPWTLALGGHFHARETIVLGERQPETRFHQTSAVVGHSANDVSGVTLYRVRNGVVDDGTFLPLEISDDGSEANH